LDILVAHAMIANPGEKVAALSSDKKLKDLHLHLKF